MPSQRIPAAVIVAGGRSRRMGHDKALLRLPDGRTTLEATLQIADLAAERVYLALDTPAHADRLLQTVGHLPTLLFDGVPGEGPLMAMAGAFRQTGVPALVLLAVDMPLVTPPLLHRLAQRAVGYDAAVFTVDGADQPLPGWYSATVVPTLEALVAGGERRLRALLDAPEIRSLRIPADHIHEHESGGLAFARANTPQEWDALCAWLAACRSD